MITARLACGGRGGVVSVCFRPHHHFTTMSITHRLMPRGDGGGGATSFIITTIHSVNFSSLFFWLFLCTVLEMTNDTKYSWQCSLSDETQPQRLPAPFTSHCAAQSPKHRQVCHSTLAPRALLRKEAESVQERRHLPAILTNWPVAARWVLINTLGLKLRSQSDPRFNPSWVSQSLSTD